MGGWCGVPNFRTNNCFLPKPFFLTTLRGIFDMKLKLYKELAGSNKYQNKACPHFCNVMHTTHGDITKKVQTCLFSSKTNIVVSESHTANQADPNLGNVCFILSYFTYPNM